MSRRYRNHGYLIFCVRISFVMAMSHINSGWFIRLSISWPFIIITSPRFACVDDNLVRMIISTKNKEKLKTNKRIRFLEGGVIYFDHFHFFIFFNWNVDFKVISYLKYVLTLIKYKIGIIFVPFTCVSQFPLISLRRLPNFRLFLVHVGKLLNKYKYSQHLL